MSRRPLADEHTDSFNCGSKMTDVNVRAIADKIVSSGLAAGSEIALGATAWHPAARGERQSGPSVGLWPGPCWYSVVLPSVVREGGLSERADAKAPRLEEPRRIAECATTLGSALLQRYWPVTAGASAVGTAGTLSLHQPSFRPLRVQPALARVVLAP